MGLRERKKLATRQALSWAAIHLAVQRGLDNVRVEDIAAAAGVSPRTFNNYFASKYEAICALTVDRAALVGEALLDRPAGEPLADSLIAAMLTYYRPADNGPDRDFVAATRQLMTEPALRGEMHNATQRAEDALAAAVARRCGLDPERDLYPGIVAAVTFGSVLAGIRHWMRSGTTEPFTDVLATALRTGLGEIR